jgi:hypothetical protein
MVLIPGLVTYWEAVVLVLVEFWWLGRSDIMSSEKQAMTSVLFSWHFPGRKKVW